MAQRARDQLRYVRQFADALDELGASVFRERYRDPVLVGIGLFGAIVDVRGRRTHAVDPASDIVAMQTLLDAVWPLRKTDTGPAGTWVTVGKDHRNDIVIAEYTLSSSHAAFCRDRRNVSVMDLDAFNGVLLDGGRLVARQATPLVTGQVLTLGRLQLRFFTAQGFFRHVRDLSRTACDLGQVTGGSPGVAPAAVKRTTGPRRRQRWG